MSDSNSDNESDDTPSTLSYADRPEWADVKPIEQDDGPNPVVKIAYSKHFSETFDYIRACMQSNELSERALELTKDACLLNAANYTIWCYRRKLLFHLGSDLDEELRFIAQMIRRNPKNYQVTLHYCIRRHRSISSRFGNIVVWLSSVQARSAMNYPFLPISLSKTRRTITPGNIDSGCWKPIPSGPKSWSTSIISFVTMSETTPLGINVISSLLTPPGLKMRSSNENSTMWRNASRLILRTKVPGIIFGGSFDFVRPISAINASGTSVNSYTKEHFSKNSCIVSSGDFSSPTWSNCWPMMIDKRNRKKTNEWF